MPFPVSITQVKAKFAVLFARLCGRRARAVTYGDLTGLYVAEDLTLPDTVIDDFMSTEQPDRLLQRMDGLGRAAT